LAAPSTAQVAALLLLRCSEISSKLLPVEARVAGFPV
jgi:hypothetical protein